MANQPTQLDPQVVNLTKAIRQIESGGNFQAQGKSGEYGAYQFTQPTWDNLSQKYLGTKVDLKSATPEQQNEVAYKQISDWKSSGKNVGQIASMWNAGAGEPNAYLGTFSNGKPSTGKNSYGVQFDVPSYAKSVATAYQTLKAGGQVNADPNNPSSIIAPQAQPPEAPSVGGFIGNVFSSGANVLGGLGQAILHPIQTAENIGNLAQGAVENTSNLALGTKFNDQTTQIASNVGNVYAQKYGGSNPIEIGKNIASTFYKDPVGTALDFSTFLDGVGGTIGAVGKISDVAKATELAKASDFISTASGILKSGSPEAIQALKTPGTLTHIADAVKTVADYTNPIKPVSSLASGITNKLSDLTEALPRRIINNLLPQLKNPETIDYATSNLKLGSVDSMLEKSQESLDGYGSQIKSILTHPDYADTTVGGSDIAEKTLSQFPNSEYTNDILFSKIKSQVPGSAALVTKLEKGSLTLDEANTLRQAIDGATYKLSIDSPEVKAGKELAAAFGNSIRENIKTVAPETRAIFSNYAKEINLKKALIKLSLKEGKKGAVSIKELLGVIGGTTLGGPIGGAATLAGEKLINSPGFKVGAAKVLKNVAVPVAKTAAKVVSKTAPFLKEGSAIGRVSGATNP